MLGQHSLRIEAAILRHAPFGNDPLPLAEQVPSTRLATAPRVEGGQLVLEGHGWGHGVGMCQYGASGCAARGADYRSILRRYYPGADLMRMP